MDIRPAPDSTDAGDERRWRFDVTRFGDANASVPARLEFRGVARVPSRVELRVLDRELGRVIDPRVDSVYEFVSTLRSIRVSAADARFELVAGSTGHIGDPSADPSAGARATRLVSVFPSPMTSSTTIRFEIAENAPVRLKVFDVAGRCVRALAGRIRAAGRHEIAWSGRDDHDRSVPAGVYLLRLTTPGHRDQRRVIKLR